MIYPLQALMNTLTSSLITLANILLNARTIRVLILSTFSLYWLVLLHIPWPNNGDYGINLPMNLLCWGVMSMLSLLVWLFLRTATVRITRTSILMLASAVLACLFLTVAGKMKKCHWFWVAADAAAMMVLMLSALGIALLPQIFPDVVLTPT